MEKQKNNFKNYQNEKTAKRLIVIKMQIELYKKNKVSFKNITEMAKTISEYLTKQDAASCSSSTILRNSQYKILIEEYFYSQKGVKKPGEASNLIAELTLSNIERENHRLRQYISNLEQELEEIKNKDKNNKLFSKDNNTYLNSQEVSLANTKKALNFLVQHFEGLVAINKNGDLVDLTKKINNIIVTNQLLKE